MIGEMLGSYRVVSKLGEGGMGVVYVGEHPMIGRKVAIKLLLPELSRDQEIVARFFNEARSTASIRHAGLVDVFDFGYHAGSGSAYLVMELLQGESLGARLRREPRLPLGLALVITRQVAGALAAAHAQGIVHRDLKPDNLFLVADRDVVGGVRVKVLDFGIAKLAQEGTGTPGAIGSGPLRTRTGAVMGTPLYMSPEQCKGAGQVDHRSDVYALGCILYECLCGRPPFGGEGFGEIIGKHMYEPVPPPRTLAPAIPEGVERVIVRALAKSASERFQSMQELEAALPDAASVPGAASAAEVAMAKTLAPTPTPAPLPPPTTLGGAAGAVSAPAEPRPKRNLRLLAGVGVGVVVVGGALAAVLAGGGAKAPVAASVPADAAVPKLVAAATPPAMPPDAAPAPPPDGAISEPPVTLPTSPPPPPSKTPPNLPVALTLEDVKNGLARVRPAIDSCTKVHGGGDATAQLTLTIDGAGRVTSAQVGRALAGSALGSCLESAVRGMTTRRWRGPSQVLTYPLRLGRATEPSETPSALPPPADDDEAFVRLTDHAQSAIARGKYAAALEDASRALELRPNDPDALTLGALAACGMKKVRVARQFALRLPESRRQQAVNGCARLGSSL